MKCINIFENKVCGNFHIPLCEIHFVCLYAHLRISDARAEWCAFRAFTTGKKRFVLLSVRCAVYACQMHRHPTLFEFDMFNVHRQTRALFKIKHYALNALYLHFASIYFYGQIKRNETKKKKIDRSHRTS